MSKTTKIVLGAVVAVIIIIIISLVGIYNGLVGGRENVNKSWAQVENQYQRRFDLIPNLVESVKGAMKQEQQVFGDLAEARTKYAGAATTEEKVGAVNQVEGALARLLVIMENYPQLKSVEAVQTLMAQLEGTENRVSVERGRYNDAVQIYNVSVKIFPRNIVAGWFGFSPRTMFAAVQEAATAPKVNLEVK
ncbi:MAG: LemA protein [Candidatus Magasanikbacteria bacterium GW2011_GWC2_40_17]|uniref:LemA protein n=1 Tax=Candidatus Magasanikbacteria bacterium GW2011_GWA2_42_32 TaxID=1619039 RepID=A0A0G1A7D3_9BACT|nr:MAG: LemA protein [Candidatus Magasanikbacteria bacterium GW2011_GWC2_40_17]KKS56957.1 MAG: LemA protein [Candidatus Magasanikbacteria bacterium GW2011_GWA2_42_32]OGH85688.1 MAG: LemA family protein [Candidatus Magasanikbacteria bacterium RIFOXYB2_FULL_38_10]